MFAIYSPRENSDLLMWPQMHLKPILHNSKFWRKGVIILRNLSLHYIRISVIHSFMSHLRIWDVTNAIEGQQNLCLCSALRASEQGTMFIVPHKLWHKTFIFIVPFGWLLILRNTREWWGPILTRIITGALYKDAAIFKKNNFWRMQWVF